MKVNKKMNDSSTVFTDIAIPGIIFLENTQNMEPLVTDIAVYPKDMFVVAFIRLSLITFATDSVRFISR